MTRHLLILRATLFLSSFVGSAAYAACSVTTCQEVTITFMQINPTNNGYWVGTSGTETALTCIPNSGEFLWMSNTGTQSREVYALVLAAQMGGRSVNIEVGNTPGQPCTISYVTLRD